MTKLILFDCDGTLVDSQHMIISAARKSFAQQGLPIPDDQAVRRIVGLSLPEALRVLVDDPAIDEDVLARLVSVYREAYLDLRQTAGNEMDPLYAGIRDALDHFAQKGILMGVATGNSMRGLRRVIDYHELDRYFISLQTADGHPSKPHPSMVDAAMAETGADKTKTIVIGDTVFDMQMASNAGALSIGVDWGYHEGYELEQAGARALARHGSALPKLAKALFAENEVVT